MAFVKIHTNLNFLTALVVFLSFIHNFARAQTEADLPAQQVFITGNLYGKPHREELDYLKALIAKQQTPVTLIYCGDLVNIKDKIAAAEDSAFIRELLEIHSADSTFNIYFVPGDAEWDHSEKDGWKHVRHAEKLIKGMAGKEIFFPGDGCPGPEVIDIGNDLRVVMINTPWLIHPYERPYAPDDVCKIMSEEQFFEALEDVIEETKDKHLLLVGHHPVLSHGQYAGRMNFTHYLYPPILGSFIAGYHQNIGSTKDLSYPSYKNFSKVLKHIMENNSAFIYASAHEYNLQALQYAESYQLISGGLSRHLKAHSSDNTIYNSKNKGFMSLSYFSSGKVVLHVYEKSKDGIFEEVSHEIYRSACLPEESGAMVNSRVVPCRDSTAPATTTIGTKGEAVAGQQYKGGPFKKFFLGRLYRSSWATKVSVPYMNLDTLKGGLLPTGTGGGRQTQSLSLRGGDGKTYVFRSVDKDPVKALSPRLRKTFVAGLARQFTATQHPYGALPVSTLLDSTSIIHAQPELYIMPADARLGIYHQQFEGMLGMLEEKPKERDEDHPGSYGADDIVRSFDLFRKMYKDNDNRVDELAFLEARIFDMWIGDWGRHEDNWKWAGFDSGKKTIYKPIPRDRDHAFSIWNGLLPKLANRPWAMPNVESFEKNFKDIQSLTYPARHLDRMLLTSLQKEDWEKAAMKMKSTFNDALIDSAIKKFPAEVIPVSGITIGNKLKSRRDKLLPAAMEYYKLLARKVNVVGSNKAEHFLIERKPDESVEVTVRDIKSGVPADTAFYHRIFNSDETKYIHVYGLDGDDIILVSGHADHSIPVRIFAGKGNDSIVNSATSEKSRKQTWIYDYKSDENKISPGKNSRTTLSDDRSLVEYNRQPVHYDTYLPLPLLYYTPEDGIAAGLGLLYTFHRFGEIGYFNKLRITNRFSTKGNAQVKIMDEFHHVLGRWDLLLNAEIAQPYPTTYFYGAGNETVKLTSAPRESYQAQVYGYAFFSGLQRVFWNKSRFYFGLTYEHNNARLHEENFMQEINIFGLERLDYAGPEAGIEIDFRDNALIPKQGARFFASQDYLHFNGGSKNDFANTKVSLEFYQTRSMLIPITLGLKGAFGNSSGDVPFYKLNTLGRTSGLRGFSRDRFAGKTSATFNSQLSAEVGTLRTVLAPLTFGLYGFYDLGRVWVPQQSSDKLHAGYGMGVYFTPLFEILTTRISISFSEESQSGLFEVGLGIGF